MEYTIDYFSKANFIRKFDKIIEARYRTEKADTPNKQMRAFYSAYKEKYSHDKFDIGTSVRQWRSFKSKSNQLPNVENLMKLCSVLKCDINYFLTEQEEFEKDVQHAADTIGLGYTETEIISNLPPEQKEILSILIISQNLGILLKDFADYAHANLQHGVIIDDKLSEDNEHKERKIDGNELRMIRRYDISNKINNILESLRSFYWNSDLKSGVNALKQRLNSNDNSAFDELYNELKI